MKAWPPARRRSWRIAAAVLLGWLALLWALDRLFPLPLPDASADAATVVVDRHGVPLRAYPNRHGVWRYPVTVDDVAPAYLDALLGYEDRRFHHHRGIDPLALLRAAWQLLRYGEIVSGGSTISMQVARLLDPVPRSLTGKLRQMLRAVQLEWHLDKREILGLYLNFAPFGGTLEGVQAASWGYLGKPASRLTDAEAALLAVLPQAPSRLRPDRAPAAAQAARDKVLQRLADLGIWDAPRVADARLEQVVSRRLRPPMLAALAADRLRAAQPRQPRIDSTLDAELQRRIEAQVAAWAARLPPQTSAAAMLVDVASMDTLAYVGRARFGYDTSAGHVDMLRAWRSPGSTLKPFVYGLALDDGLIHSASMLVDAPQDFDGYRPGNFDQQFRGPVSAAKALRLSLNVPAVALLDALGPSRWAARLGRAGVRLRLPRGTEPHLAMVLGGTEVRMDQLIAAYAALSADGLARPIRLAADDPSADAQQLLSPAAAWVVARMLRDGEPEARYFERSGRAELLVKTGTSYGFRDAWALGATRQHAVGVWVGRPDGTPLPGHYGAISALPLLRAIVDGLPRANQITPVARPEGASEELICWPLGRRASETPEHLCHRRLDALVVAATVPPTLAPKGEREPPRALRLRVDADSGQRLGADCRRPHREAVAEIALWPALAAPWLGPTERRRSALPPLASDCREDAPIAARLRILGIDEGTLLRAAPNSKRPPTVSVRASGASGAVRWLLDGVLVGETVGEGALTLALDDGGERQLLALDAQQRYGLVRFRVQR